MAFRSIQYYGRVGDLDQVQENVSWYLREGIIQAGGYNNISSGTLGYGGEDLSRLRPTYTPGIGNYRIWRGLSHQWVFESGVVDTGQPQTPVAPIAVSGVYVDDVFYPTSSTTGTYEHYVDYNRGAIIFANAQASGSNIWCERTERAAFTYPAESDEYRNFLYRHVRSNLNNPPGSGIDVYTQQNSAELPSVFIEVERGRSRPYELGSNALFTDFKITFHIFAEHVSDFKTLRDICGGLEDYNIATFDVNQASSGNYPLDYLARLNPDRKDRSELINLFPLNKVGRFKNSRDKNFNTYLPLYRGPVTLDFELLT